MGIIIIVTVSRDRSFLDSIRKLLAREYSFIGVSSLEQVYRHKPNLVIIDTTSYDENAVDICRELRADVVIKGKPVLLLTGHLDAHQAAELLDAGADDLLRKPFADSELIARVRALTRWENKPKNTRRPQLRLVEPHNMVYVDQQAIYLTPMEFRLLGFLCQNRDRFFTADELLTELWEYPAGTGDTALVRNHIRNLRRKLEEDPDRPLILISRYGQGYTIQAVVQRA